jgi:hypothetical protein
MTIDILDHAGPGGSYKNPRGVNLDDGFKKPVWVPPELTPLQKAIGEARNAVIAREEAKRKEAIKPGGDEGAAKDDEWQGIFKLGEELHELGVELMKLAAFPDGKYPDDGTPLLERLIEEATDVQATLDYFRQKNGIPVIALRYNRKLARYARWHLSGIKKPKVIHTPEYPRDAIDAG